MTLYRTKVINQHYLIETLNYKMKKSILFTMLAMVVGFAMTSCKDDTQPRLDKPTEFVLNTPPMADQLYELSAESVLHFTVTQPNYGVATTPTYQLEIAKDEAFTEFVAIEAQTTEAKINVTGEQFALALCSLFGYTDRDNYDDYVRPVYVRAHAWLAGDMERSEIYSNPICLKQVKPYFAVKVADTIWVVGDCEGWSAAPNPDWALTETEPESKIYKGRFVIEAGKFQFRFYDDFNPDNPWEWYSIGSQNDDAPIEISDKFEDGVYEGNCVFDFETEKAGKGSWQYTDWPGGTVDITVNLGSKKVTFAIVNE